MIHTPKSYPVVSISPNLSVDNFDIWEEFIENYESVRVFKLDLKNQKRTDYKSFQSFTDNTSTELHNKETQEIKTQKNTEPNSQIDINYQNIVISNSELPMDEPLTREEMVEAIKEDIKTTKKIVTNIITELKVWPNPSMGELWLQWPNGVKKGEVKIVDITGRMVYSTEIYRDRDFTQLQANYLNPGVYFISLKSDQGFHGKSTLVIIDPN